MAGLRAATVPIPSACLYDLACAVDPLPRTDDLGALARATFTLPDGGRLRAELTWSCHSEDDAFAPSPVNPGGLPGNPPVVFPATSPFFPDGLGLSGNLVNPGYRTAPLGPRVLGARTLGERLLVGWKDELSGWPGLASIGRPPWCRPGARPPSTRRWAPPSRRAGWRRAGLGRAAVEGIGHLRLAGRRGRQEPA